MKKRNFEFQNSIATEIQKAGIDLNPVRLTAGVTRLGWEGGEAVETESRESQEIVEKRGAYPKSGARLVRRTPERRLN